MADGDIAMDGRLARLADLAGEALALWDLPGAARVRLINVSENVTFLVEASGEDPALAEDHSPLAVLRVHREGYQARRAIDCELAWIAALRNDTTVAVPRARPGRNGALIQQAGARHLVLFDHIAGEAPDPASDLTGRFEELGEMAARLHLQAMSWARPVPFERLTWDLPQVFGSGATRGEPTWGDWRAAPGVTPQVRDTLEKVEATVCNRLEAFGRGPDCYGLIHADMRMANLIVSPRGTHLIDFDDCGFGWHLYDFAAAISFIEEDPRVPALWQAWLAGYRRVRALSDAEAHEIDTFVMLRRMALLAWIGSHIEAPEPQDLAPHFADGTARLGAAYLGAIGKTRDA